MFIKVALSFVNTFLMVFASFPCMFRTGKLHYKLLKHYFHIIWPKTDEN